MAPRQTPRTRTRTDNGQRATGALLMLALVLMLALALVFIPAVHAAAADPTAAPPTPPLPLVPLTGDPLASPTSPVSPAVQDSRALGPRIPDPTFAVSFGVSSPQTYNPAHTVFTATTVLTTTAYSYPNTVVSATYVSPTAVNLVFSTYNCPNANGIITANTVTYGLLLPSLPAGTTCSVTAQATLGNAGTYTFDPILLSGDQQTILAGGTPVSFILNPAATSAALTGNPTTAIFGQAVTFTATITDKSNGNVPLPDGESVTFLDGTTVIGTGVTGGDSGQVSFTTTLLAPGSHAITARHEASTNYAASANAPTVNVAVDNPQGMVAAVAFSPSGNLTAGTSETVMVTIIAGNTDLYFNDLTATLTASGFNLGSAAPTTTCTTGGTATTLRFPVAFRATTDADTPFHLIAHASCTLTSPAAVPVPGTYTADAFVSQNGTTLVGVRSSSTLNILPTAPALAAAVPGNAQVALTWSAVPGATGYTVQRGTDGGATFPVAFSLGAVTTYTDPTAANGTAYTYRVVAVTGALTSDPSNTRSATPGAVVTALHLAAPMGAGSGNSGNATAPLIVSGASLTLTVTATYIDGTTRPLAVGLTYSGFDPAKLSVSAGGVVTGAGAGGTTITLTAPDGVGGTTTTAMRVIVLSATPPNVQPPREPTVAPMGTAAPQPTRRPTTAPAGTPIAQPARH